MMHVETFLELSKEEFMRILVESGILNEKGGDEEEKQHDSHHLQRKFTT